jgi:parvulin-like peptidyl-prolyl isomerase
MMRTLRKKTRLVLFIALAGFLLLIFFQWGFNIMGVSEERETDIAKVDGIPVSYTEYLRFAQQKEVEYRGISTDDIWALMIEEVMWQKLTQREKLGVTDEEILMVIRSNPPREVFESEYFQDENGQFDYNKYVELLRSPQSRPWLLEYERNLRKELPREKLRSLLATLGWVSPYEDSMLIAAQTTRYDLTVFMLTYFRVLNLFTISEEEARAYYESNREDFMRPESRILKYVFFERKPSQFDTIEAREGIEDFVARMEEGEDFLMAAQELSDDSVVVREFEGEAGLQPYLMEVYKKLTDGEISAMIEGPHGYELIMRVGRGKIYQMKKDIDVSRITLGDIYERVMAFKEAAREIGFDSAAVEQELQIRTTYPLRTDNITFPVRDTDGLAAFVKKAKHNDIGGPFGSMGGFYLFALDSVIPAAQPAFEEIVPQVEAMMERGFIKEKSDSIISDYYDRLMAGATMEDIARSDTLIMYSPQTDVSLDELRRPMGDDFSGAVAQLEPGQISSPLVTEWAAYIIRCDAKRAVPFDSSMIAALQLKRQFRVQELTMDIFEPEQLKDKRDVFFE